MGLINARSDKFAEHEVNGETLRFYSVSFFTLRKLRGIIAKLSGAFSVLLSGGPEDQSKVVEQIVSADGDPNGISGTKVTTNAIHPDLANVRLEKRRSAIEEAIQTLLDDGNALAVGELILSSMRDVTGGKRLDQKDVKEFIDEVDAPTLVQMLVGTVKGNAAVFGDAGGSLGKALRARLQDIVAPAVAQTDGEPSSSASSS